MKFKFKRLSKILFPLFKQNENSQSTFNSKNYWNNRYLNNDNSGSGSYGELASFKAKVINEFVKNYKINSVIELGCGDGNQLKFSDYKNYIGFDVSSEAVNLCTKIFKDDETKVFLNYSDIENSGYTADLVLSLDVIFHLIEDEVFEDYMKNLFNLSSKYVIIYSSNYNEIVASHVRCRKFTDWIKFEIKEEFRLLKFVPNIYPYNSKYPTSTTFSDFYIYEKVIT